MNCLPESDCRQYSSANFQLAGLVLLRYDAVAGSGCTTIEAHNGHNHTVSNCSWQNLSVRTAYAIIILSAYKYQLYAVLSCFAGLLKVFHSLTLRYRRTMAHVQTRAVFEKSPAGRFPESRFYSTGGNKHKYVVCLGPNKPF
jgi:hypothetical protein